MSFSSQRQQEIRSRIALAMNMRGLTQADVSRETRMSSGYMSHLITGKRSINPKVTRLLAVALRVNADWLESGEGHPDDVDPKSTMPPPGERPPGYQAGTSGTVELLVRENAELRRQGEKTDAEKELLAHFRGMDDERQRALLRTARELRVAYEAEAEAARPGSDAPRQGGTKRR